MSVGIAGRARCPPTWRIERSRRPEPQVAGWDEQFERIGLRHREGNPSASREADRSHTVWIDEGLASQEDKSPVGIRRAPEKGGNRARFAGVLYPTRSIAVDEQDDIAPGNKVIDQLLLCRVMHPGTAVQPNDGGKRSCTIGLGQIALYAVARNDLDQIEPLRGAFKLHTLQGCGPCISRQRTYDAPKHQHYHGLESDCPRQCRLPVRPKVSRGCEAFPAPRPPGAPDGPVHLQQQTTRSPRRHRRATDHISTKQPSELLHHS